MSRDLHPRLLRGFVATAEALHFGRAAERLHVAQQALSRDVRALERLLGEALFTRTTRSVELTPAGHGLLPRARRLLALHDEILIGAAHRPLLLDLNSDVTGPDLTGDRVLERARSAWPEGEILARFHGGSRRPRPSCSPTGWTSRSVVSPVSRPGCGPNSPRCRSGWTGYR